MSDVFRPATKVILAAVAAEFGVQADQLAAHTPDRKAKRARYAATLLLAEQGYHVTRIAEVMQRSQAGISNWLVTARAILREDSLFEVQVSTVRAELLKCRQRKPVFVSSDAERKLQQYMPQLMKLRNLYGPERGWSTAGLSRHFGIPKPLLDQLFGVQTAERR